MRIAKQSVWSNELHIRCIRVLATEIFPKISVASTHIASTNIAIADGNGVGVCEFLKGNQGSPCARLLYTDGFLKYLG